MGHKRSLHRATGTRALLALAGAAVTLLFTAGAALPHPNTAGATSSRDDYLDGVQAGFPDYLVFQPSGPIAVRLSGNSASLRFPVSFDLLLGDLRLTHQAWVTELWERRGGRWQIVWEQATAIPNNSDLLVEALEPVG